MYIMLNVGGSNPPHTVVHPRGALLDCIFVPLTHCAPRSPNTAEDLHSIAERLRCDADFGRLPGMRAIRVLLPTSGVAAWAAVFACSVVAEPMPEPETGSRAYERWLYAPAPDAPNATSSIPELVPRYRSSPASKAAWIHQGDWLRGRLRARGLRLGSPVHIRIFKQSRELELYLLGRDGFELLRNYPICDVSGTLGPKRFEGDLQAPEGFYTVRPERLHPHSEYHLAFNLGFPNGYDRSLGRTGSNIMIHGGCASRGCFAMSDYYMEQIYILAEAALKNGQRAIGVEIYPFRMTAANLAAQQGSRWIEFWHSLKPAHDHFGRTGMPASIEWEAGGYRLAESGSGGASGTDHVSAP